MKPQRFFIGQEVTPVKPPVKQYVNTNHPVRPGEVIEFGKVYKIKGYYIFYAGRWYVDLEGMPDTCSYQEDVFAPVVSDTVLEKELESNN